MTDINYSIIICTYNQRSTLEKSLEKLRLQIKQPRHFEVIIADDCSTDDTQPFIKSLRFPIFLKYCRSEYQSGRAENRNRGIEKAVGEWLIFLDGDIIPDNNFVQVLLGSLNHPEKRVYIGSLQYPPEWKSGNFEKYYYSRGRLNFRTGQAVPGKYFTSSNFAIKNSAMKLLSGFDIKYKSWGGEDTDFGLRLEKAGLEITYLADAICYHYDRKSINEIIDGYEKYGEHGCPILFSKHPNIVIFKFGWLLGLPDSNKSAFKKFLAGIVRPLHSGIILGCIKILANIWNGKLANNLVYDWLLYGHLARGYRKAKK